MIIFPKVAKQLPQFVEKWGQDHDFPLQQAISILTNSTHVPSSKNQRSAVLLLLSRLQIEEAIGYVKSHPECLRKEDGSMSSLTGILRAYVATLPELGGARRQAEEQLRAATAA